MLPFQLAGLEVVRRRSKLPLLPVVVDGFWPARTVKSTVHLVGRRITVRILQPVPAREVEDDPRRAYGRIERMIRSELSSIREAEAARGEIKLDARKASTRERAPT